MHILPQFELQPERSRLQRDPMNPLENGIGPLRHLTGPGHQQIGIEASFANANGGNQTGQHSGTTENRFKRWIVTSNGTPDTIEMLDNALKLHNKDSYFVYTVTAKEVNASGGLHLHTFLYTKERASPQMICRNLSFLEGSNFKPVGALSTDTVIHYIKKPGRAEKITHIVKKLASGEWEESDAMTYNMPLWMEKGDAMMKAAGDFRLQQARKNWVQPKL